MIKIEHLNKRFKKLHALADVSADIPGGSVVSLIGPNGSGKTTLIKCILGMVRADSGNIYFDNKLVHKDFKYRNRIGYMPQIGRYPDNMKIGQVLEMIKNVRGISEQELDNDLYEAFDIESIKDKSMRSLSGGTRQKVSATLAFMFDPDVFILDEPTAGLDPVASEILKDKITKEKRRGKLILLSSHILSDLEELTTDIMYLNEGRLQFFEPISTIRDITGEKRLSKAIAKLMQHGFSKDEMNSTSTHQTRIVS
ncbi:MAG: ABC transporter ATP-binding protein [Chitinophagaceae bacterium]|nr:ABC transporter ATP-binding protein [Chitinophagaceae bacterium]